MDNKEIQRKRMLSYFIESANTIIEKEGLESVTIRKVAKLAGYNSATLYNYFENLNHLLFYASVKYLKDYAENLPKYIKGSKDPIEAYLNVWKCFCYYSYLKPEVFSLIFFSEFTHSQVNDSIKTYYSIFPEEISEESKKFFPILLEDNIHIRDYTLLKAAADKGFIKEENIHDINEMNVLIYQGMLSRLLSKNIDFSVEEAVEKTLKYIEITLNSYRVD